MGSAAARLKEVYSSSASLQFTDTCLRGIGQVIFQNNPLSGTLFLAALFWGSFLAGVPHVAIGGTAALVAATATAAWLRADREAFRAGLFGYNGILTGLALTYFLGPGPAVLAYAVLGGCVTAIAMLGPINATKPWSVPAHTYPFVLVTWIFLLAAYGFSGPPASIPGASAAPLDPIASDPLRVLDFIAGVFRSISQIFFKESIIAAALIVAGLAVNSVAAAAFAVGGAFLAVVSAHFFGVESVLITSGLQGFSPVLTAVALGTVFFRPSIRVAAFAALGTVVTVIAQSALTVALSPLALPPLSVPFDLVALIFFVGKSRLDAGKAN